MTIHVNYGGPNGRAITSYGGANAAGFPAPVVFEGVLDCSKTAAPMVQNDTAEVIAIPAGTFIQGIVWEVETVEGAARNFAIGDGSNTSGYIPTTTANSLASGATVLTGLVLGGAGDPANDPLVVTGYTSGKYYAAADTIDVLAVTAGGLTGAKIRIKAFGWVVGL